MRAYTCCFTGHRAIDEDISKLKQRLKAQLIKLIDNGMLYFGVGGARGFDNLAAHTIIELKHTYPNIKLILVLPCLNHTEKWHKADKTQYNIIKNNADKIRILSAQYETGCMHTRNRHLVDHASVCICYMRKAFGGTAYTVQYAVKKGLRMIYL